MQQEGQAPNNNFIGFVHTTARLKQLDHLADKTHLLVVAFQLQHRTLKFVMGVLEFTLDGSALRVFRLKFLCPFNNALFQSRVQSFNFLGPLLHSTFEGNVERADFLFHQFSLADVQHRGQHLQPARRIDRIQADLYRELAAVFPQPIEITARSHGPG